MPKNGTNNRQPKLASGEGYCRKCTKIKSLNDFYEATNPFLDTNGYMSICKECCNDLYNHYFSIYNNLEKALYLTCQDLDVRFNDEALKQTQSHVDSILSKGKKIDKVFGIYKSKLSSTGKNNAGIDCFRFKDSDYIENTNIINSNKEDDIYYKTLEKYWGKNRTLWEYEFLEEEMVKIKASFECPDYSMEMLMRDICFINLEIEKVRQTGKGDVTKLIETRSKLMTDANMKPVQATGAEANDQITFGTLIKKWENEKPIPSHLDDEMKKYIDTYMVGHLAKMEGLNNDLVNKYNESLKEYTIDLNSLDDEEDDS